jgi:hypothetical protein
MLANVHPAQARDSLSRIIALADLMHVVPAHDVRAHDPIPKWISGKASVS